MARQWIALMAATVTFVGVLAAIIMLHPFSVSDSVNPIHDREAPSNENNHGRQVVSPTFDLDDLTRVYELSLGEAQAIGGFNAEFSLQEFENTWRRAKETGDTLWGSDAWMRSPEYYRNLDTIALTDECFERGIFHNEVGVWNDPRKAYIRLGIMHNGFAALFAREDLRDGLLRAYEYCASKLTPSSDLKTIVAASGQLDALSIIYQVPELKAHVKGHEARFFDACLATLQRFRSYIDEFDREALGTSTPFYTEPCEVARNAIVLGKQLDLDTYAEIEPRIRAYRLSGNQDIDELGDYLDFVLQQLGRIRGI